ncbi:hypothetical protein QBA54_38535 [Streptomyces sp. B21-108]|uniref:hypothetical protein n=1 Tax=Streptomyces sp. B21-108 TaxID=3039419 RepID=UPI002FF326C0
MQPPDHRTIDDLLAKARTRDRYATYNMAAAETRLRTRQTARHRPLRQRTTDTALAHTAWTPPANDSTPDADRAWWNLNAVCLLVLGPDADSHLADFMISQYAEKAGALVFACLLHLTDDSGGARFWWRFAAGAGHQLAEYCLFLEHAHSGEYHDTDYCRHHCEIGIIPLPQPALVDQLRNLTSPPCEHGPSPFTLPERAALRTIPQRGEDGGRVHAGSVPDGEVVGVQFSESFATGARGVVGSSSSLRTKICKTRTGSSRSCVDRTGTPAELRHPRPSPAGASSVPVRGPGGRGAGGPAER